MRPTNKPKAKAPRGRRRPGGGARSGRESRLVDRTGKPVCVMPVGRRNPESIDKLTWRREHPGGNARPAWEHS